MADKKLVEKLVERGALSVASSEPKGFTREEQAQLDKVRQEWEKSYERVKEDHALDRKRIWKFGVITQLPGAFILAMTALSVLGPNPASAAERMFGYGMGGMGLLAPVVINGISWIKDQLDWHFDLKRALKHKEQEILKARQKEAIASLRDVLEKKTAEADKVHNELMEKVRLNAEKKKAEASQAKKIGSRKKTVSRGGALGAEIRKKNSRKRVQVTRT
ncbi:MAG: hypothetical protein II942_05395 [Alphaproteobacteria bacterium]|nr:hypothetical protein [Alphaproteobacteria bacterium]